MARATLYAGGAPPRHASEPTYGELVSLSALRKVPGHIGRECQPSWLGRRGRGRTKKVAARVCTRRAPSHTVQSCVSGPFGALEPNGAYSGGAPHTPRWRQVNLDSVLFRRARQGREATLCDCATRCAAAHHAQDSRPAIATATAPPPHRHTPPYRTPHTPRHPTTNQRGCARRRRGSPRDPPFAAHTPAAPAFIWVPEPWLVKLAPGCQSLAGRQSLAPAPDPSAPCVSRPPHTSHTP